MNNMERSVFTPPLRTPHTFSRLITWIYFCPPQKSLWYAVGNCKGNRIIAWKNLKSCLLKLPENTSWEIRWLSTCWYVDRWWLCDHLFLLFHVCAFPVCLSVCLISLIVCLVDASGFYDSLKLLALYNRALLTESNSHSSSKFFNHHQQANVHD